MNGIRDSVVEAASVLAEVPKDVVELTSGASVEIRVCSGRQLPRVLELVSSVASDLGIVLSDADGIQEKLLSKVNDVGFILKLIAKYSQDVYTVVWSLTSLESLDEVSDLPLDDLCKVIIRVIEVNRDFFTGRVLPIFASMASPRASQEKLL